MEPALPVGSLVVIKPRNAYQAGDIITFGPDTKTEVPTTHRITSVREEGGGVWYATKGDANEEADTKEVAKNDVIGKVLVGIPYLGFVLDFARKPLGFGLLVGVPAALIMLDEIGNIVREVMDIRRRKGGIGVREEVESASRRIGKGVVTRRVVYARRSPVDDVFYPTQVFERAGRYELDLRKSIRV